MFEFQDAGLAQSISTISDAWVWRSSLFLVTPLELSPRSMYVFVSLFRILYRGTIIQYSMFNLEVFTCRWSLKILTCVTSWISSSWETVPDNLTRSKLTCLRTEKVTRNSEWTCGSIHRQISTPTLSCGTITMLCEFSVNLLIAFEGKPITNFRITTS